MNRLRRFGFPATLSVLLVVFPMLFLFAQDGRIIRVDALSSAFPHKADGSSWDKAYTDLHLALASARLGDWVWVASGTYVVAQVGDVNPRGRVFEVRGGVFVFGSFANRRQARGDDSRRDELVDRDYVAYPTILTGDIDGSGGPTEPDALRVVRLEQDALLDGFSITTCYGGSNKSATLAYMEGRDSSIAHCRISGGRVESFTTSPGVSAAGVGSALYYCVFSRNENVLPIWRGTDAFVNAGTIIVNCTMASTSGGTNVLCTLGGLSPNATLPFIVQNTIMLDPSGGLSVLIREDQNTTEFLKRNVKVEHSYLPGGTVQAVTVRPVAGLVVINKDAPVEGTGVRGRHGSPPRLDADFKQRIGSITRDSGSGEDEVAATGQFFGRDTDIFGTVVPQGTRDIGAHEYVPDVTLEVTSFSPNVVFREVDRTVTILGSGFGDEISALSVTFLGDPDSTKDDRGGVVLEQGSFSDRLLVEFPVPNDIETGKVRVVRSGRGEREGDEDFTSISTLGVAEFRVDSFDPNPFLAPAHPYPGKGIRLLAGSSPRAAAYPRGEVTLSGIFPRSEDPRLRVILPGGESEELVPNTTGFLVHSPSAKFVVPNKALEPGRLKVAFGPKEIESPYEFRILHPELISIPSEPVSRGDEIVLKGKDFYDLGGTTFEVHFEGASGPVKNVTVGDDPSKTDPAFRILTVRVPVRAVSGRISVRVHFSRMVSKTPLNVVGHRAPKFGIDDFVEETRRGRQIVVLGTFSSISNAIGFPNGRGGMCLCRIFAE